MFVSVINKIILFKMKKKTIKTQMFRYEIYLSEKQHAFWDMPPKLSQT